MSASVNTIDITNILCEFLEVAIHNILYTRKLYPETIFAPCKKYGVVVYQSQHPLLNDYITQVLKSAQSHLKNNQLKQLFLYIKTDSQVIERYVFDLLQIQNKIDDRDLLLVKLEQNLRSFCLKLTNSTGSFEQLGDNSEFSVVLHTTEFSAVSFNEEQESNEFPWVPINVSTESESVGIVPLQTIDTDNLILQIYVEKNNTNR